MILNRFLSHDEAIRCWQQCIEQDPEGAEPYYWLGREVYRKGRYEEAIAHYRRACDLGCSQADVRLQLADALFNRGWVEEAVPILQEQVRAEPAVTAGHFYLGQAFYLLGRLDEAVACYQRALDTNPDCHQALYGLAMISQKRGDAAASRGYFEKFRALQGSSLWVTRNRSGTVTMRMY